MFRCSGFPGFSTCLDFLLAEPEVSSFAFTGLTSTGKETFAMGRNLLCLACAAVTLRPNPHVITGLPVWQSQSENMQYFSVYLFIYFFRVGKSLARHSPAKRCLCA